LLTGRKRYQKVLRYHTGYPAGLREIPYDKLLQDDPARAIRHAVKGMIPKTRNRDVYLDKYLIVEPERYHNWTHVGLPQFTRQLPRDITHYMSMDDVTKDTYDIVYETDPASTPAEFKDFDRVLDRKLVVPEALLDKPYRTNVKNRRLGRAFKLAS
jgi:hypothetical protein